jgi:hypothetical protein
MVIAAIEVHCGESRFIVGRSSFKGAMVILVDLPVEVFHFSYDTRLLMQVYGERGVDRL